MFLEGAVVAEAASSAFRLSDFWQLPAIEAVELLVGKHAGEGSGVR